MTSSEPVNKSKNRYRSGHQIINKLHYRLLEVQFFSQKKDENDFEAAIEVLLMIYGHGRRRLKCFEKISERYNGSNFEGSSRILKTICWWTESQWKSTRAMWYDSDKIFEQQLKQRCFEPAQVEGIWCRCVWMDGVAVVKTWADYCRGYCFGSFGGETRSNVMKNANLC